MSANDAANSRQRKLLSHAFSDQVLREQEPVLRSHVDLLHQTATRTARSQYLWYPTQPAMGWATHTTAEGTLQVCF